MYQFKSRCCHFQLLFEFVDYFYFLFYRDRACSYSRGSNSVFGVSNTLIVFGIWNLLQHRPCSVNFKRLFLVIWVSKSVLLDNEELYCYGVSIMKPKLWCWKQNLNVSWQQFRYLHKLSKWGNSKSCYPVTFDLDIQSATFFFFIYLKKKFLFNNHFIPSKVIIH